MEDWVLPIKAAGMKGSMEYHDFAPNYIISTIIYIFVTLSISKLNVTLVN